MSATAVCVTARRVDALADIADGPHVTAETSRRIGCDKDAGEACVPRSYAGERIDWEVAVSTML